MRTLHVLIPQLVTLLDESDFVLDTAFMGLIPLLTSCKKPLFNFKPEQDTR
jgi:hypothetical protein